MTELDWQYETWGRSQTVFWDQDTTVEIIQVSPGQLIYLGHSGPYDASLVVLDGGKFPLLEIDGEHLIMRDNVRYDILSGQQATLSNPSQGSAVRVLVITTNR